MPGGFGSPEITDLTGILQNIVDGINITAANTQLQVQNSRNAIKQDINIATGATAVRIQNSTNSVRSAINDGNNAVKSFVGLLNNIIRGDISGARANINQVIGNTTSLIRNDLLNRSNALAQDIENVNTGLTNTLNQTSNNIVSFLNQASEDITDSLNQQADTIGNEINGVIDGIRVDIEQKVAGIGAAIAGLFAPFIEWLSEQRDKLNAFISDQRLLQTDVIEERFAKLVAIFEKMATNGYGGWDEVIADYDELTGVGGFIDGILGIILFLPIILSGTATAIQPFAQNIAHLAREVARPGLLAPSELAEALRRGVASESFVRDELGKLGFSNARIDLILFLTRPLLNFTDIRALFVRGEMSEVDHDERLKKHGVLDSDIVQIKKLYKLLPPVQDLVRFAVREVFDPEQARALDLFKEFPSEFGVQAEKLGLPRDVAEWYWGAHWELPSIGQAFEMFHRNVINQDQLRALLKAQDVAPIWRDRLEQIAFRPFTRVDVRRMHNIGVLDEAQVKRAYLDLGFDDGKADAMTEFTILYNTDDPADGGLTFRQLTRSTIERAFRRNKISFSEAVNMLVQTGYREQDAEFLISLQDINKEADLNPDRTQQFLDRMATITRDGYSRRLIPRQEAVFALIDAGYTDIEAQAELDFLDLEIVTKLKATQAAIIRELYTEYTIDINGVQIIMSRLGFGNSEIEILAFEWNMIREFRTRKPTLRQFKLMFKKGIISLDQYMDELRGLGYAEKYVADIAFVELE